MTDDFLQDNNPVNTSITLEELEVLKRKIMKDRGFDLSYYTPAYVQRRINACLMRRNCNFGQYILALDHDADEYQQFFDAFTINVTEFFRDPTVWRALLNEHLPQILLEKIADNKRTLRIWSAGCSSGEEPYTIAMSVKETIENLHNFQKEKAKPPTDNAQRQKAFLSNNKKFTMSDFVISIYATDIDNDSLSKADKGIYQKESIKNITPELMEKYFSPITVTTEGISTPQNCYKISNVIKQMVIFKNHHFFNSQFFTNMDIIFCRNVAIYFTSQMKDALLQIFYDSLAQHGVLVTGKAEAIFTRTKHLFYPMNLKEHIYRKERRDEKKPDDPPEDKDKRKNFWFGAKNPSMPDK